MLRCGKATKFHCLKLSPQMFTDLEFRTTVVSVSDCCQGTVNDRQNAGREQARRSTTDWMTQYVLTQDDS